MEEIADGIRRDLLRYSTLRAWYRYLSYEGTSYLLFPWKGEQPKNPIDTEVVDTGGMHWWVWDASFIDEIPIDGMGKDIIMRHPVVFNCFLRGLEGDVNSPVLRGWNTIKINNPNMPKKIRNAKSDFDFARLHHNEQINTAVRTAMEIYELMSKECPHWIDKLSETSSAEELNSELSTKEIPEDVETVEPVHRPRVRRTMSESAMRIHSRLSDKLSRKRKHNDKNENDV
jgi:hypothetical protein